MTGLIGEEGQGPTSPEGTSSWVPLLPQEGVNVRLGTLVESSRTSGRTRSQSSRRHSLSGTCPPTLVLIELSRDPVRIPLHPSSRRTLDVGPSYNLVRESTPGPKT